MQIVGDIIVCWVLTSASASQPLIYLRPYDDQNEFETFSFIN